MTDNFRGGSAGNATLLSAVIPLRPPPSQNIFTTVKHGLPGRIAQAAGDAYTSLTFQLTDLLENGAMNIFWSLYQISEVSVEFRPAYRANSVIFDAPNGLIPQILVAFDPDSTVAGGGSLDVDRLRRYANVVVTDDKEGFMVKFRPRVAKPVYENILINTYEPSDDSDWFPTSHPAVPHYGLYVAVTGSNNIAGPFQEWNVITRYSLRFKSER
jgi:hypothetical protein